MYSTKTRADNELSFTEISEGLPTSGEYNYIAMADFNDDNEIDIAFGGEDWTIYSSEGLYAYTGNGGTSWTDASDGLTTENSWGGLQLADADGDGYIEFYATDEHWGTSTSSGIKVYEYRSGSWTDSKIHVSTPLQVGQPNNVMVEDITDDSRPDLVVCKRTGVEYYQNNGGNPVNWEERSEGLPTTREFTGLAIADMNKDGLNDIISSDYSGGEYVFTQSTSGDLWSDSSSGLASGGIALGIAVGDVNNDNHMDVIFGLADGGIRCWLGNSGGSGGNNFNWINGSSGFSMEDTYVQIQLADIDSDGDLDLIAPEGGSGKGMQIWLGNGNTDPDDGIKWTLAEGTNLPTKGSWYGAGIYDINDDGALDIIGASYGKGIKAWLNNLGGGVEQFNLRITTNDISFSQDTIKEGDEVTIYADITNTGNLDATEFYVQFFIDDEKLGSEQQINFLNINDDTSAEIEWTAEAGEHTISVEITPTDTELESDTTDNTAEVKFTVFEKDPGKNGGSDSDGGGFLPGFEILLVAAALTGAFLIRRKMKND
jgi:hypothetical protein